MIKPLRTSQVIFGLLFLALLLTAAFSPDFQGPVDLFLRMDPGLVFISMVCARSLIPGFLPALLILLSALPAGRAFCGHICPMGITIDIADRLLAPGTRPRRLPGSLVTVKYLVLIFLLGAALAGVSYLFFASPLSLITRFYGVLLLPGALFISERAVEPVRLLAEWMEFGGISFVEVRQFRFSTQFFILIFFAGVFGLAAFSPRFWCRCLCPTGALLAFFSRSAAIRRQVRERRCNGCGRCVRRCPMAAIDEKAPEKTIHAECIACETCVKTCPEQAVFFGREKKDGPGEPAGLRPGRRRFISAGLAGAGTAVVSMTGLTSAYGPPGEGRVSPPGLIRPPGAMPEDLFLARCVRCGECMVACPTNTLQPIWFDAGVQGLFSPSVKPRRGFCDPGCHRCAGVCPTRAILPAGPADRIWAKIGAAAITRQRCLAWEFKKSCMVCDEVCPYDAIEFKREPLNPAPVPHVIEDRCAGCGYCEFFCPVQNRSAIQVTPMDAVRISRGRFRDAARSKGFDLSLSRKEHGPPEKPGGGLSPGFAPGFDE